MHRPRARATIPMRGDDLLAVIEEMMMEHLETPRALDS